jgi:metallophosphoesterase superfamily enzyme
MELLPGILAENRALYLEEAKTLILSDLHIGYEEERIRAGFFIAAGDETTLQRGTGTPLCKAGD